MKLETFKLALKVMLTFFFPQQHRF